MKILSMVSFDFGLHLCCLLCLLFFLVCVLLIVFVFVLLDTVESYRTL